MGDEKPAANAPDDMNFENIDTQRELIETDKRPIEVITPPKEEKKEEKKILTPAEKEEAKKKR